MPVFTANIPAELKIGDRIEIGGKIKKNARKMSVNLCAQEGEEPRDVVLHFDVRFHRDNIISLSRKNGLWIGSGNYDTNYNMFVPGTMFRIIFEIKDTDVITIYCQGKFHSNFLPKIPLTMAKYIVAWADIQRITHCYFHTGLKSPAGDQPLITPVSPRPPGPPVGLEAKRSTRVRKHPVQDCPQLRSSESSDDEHSVKVRQNTEGRANKFFYETLMCQQSREINKFGAAPAEPRYRSASRERVRPDCSRKFEQEHDSDYSEDVTSKNDYSVVDDTEVLPAAGSNRYWNRMKMFRRRQMKNGKEKGSKVILEI